MDRLLLGDNQFFGVNHMSEEKARAQSMRFQNIQAIIEVLDTAHEEGIRTFMCTTHERVGQICDHWRSHPDRYGDYSFFPCMPYAHKYANAVTDYGMLGAIRHFLPDEGLLDAAMRGGMSLLKKNIDGITTLLIDAEMKMFRGLKTPVIFLQNVVVEYMKTHRFRPIAMSVLASGAIPPQEAFEWVCGLPNLEAIVFGASSRGNIRHSKQLVDLYWERRFSETKVRRAGMALTALP